MQKKLQIQIKNKILYKITHNVVQNKFQTYSN